jgi:hypothetical protein
MDPGIRRDDQFVIECRAVNYWGWALLEYFTTVIVANAAIQLSALGVMSYFAMRGKR